MHNRTLLYLLVALCFIPALHAVSWKITGEPTTRYLSSQDEINLTSDSGEDVCFFVSEDQGNLLYFKKLPSTDSTGLPTTILISLQETLCDLQKENVSVKALNTATTDLNMLMGMINALIIENKIGIDANLAPLVEAHVLCQKHINKNHNLRSSNSSIVSLDTFDLKTLQTTNDVLKDQHYARAKIYDDSHNQQIKPLFNKVINIVKEVSINRTILYGATTILAIPVVYKTLQFFKKSIDKTNPVKTK